DDGGTADGGADLSPPRTFALDVNGTSSDVRTRVDNGAAFVQAGQPVTWVAEIENLGMPAVDVRVLAPLPPGLAGMSWTCGASGTTCPAGDGAGAIDTITTLPSAARLT